MCGTTIAIVDVISMLPDVHRQQRFQAFGAWGEKKNYGKVTMGTLRKTFIFDENGILERIIEKVETKNHTAQIL